MSINHDALDELITEAATGNRDAVIDASRNLDRNDPTQRLLHSALRKLAMKSQEIDEAAASIEMAMSQLRDRISKSQHVNALGELQGRGARLDILCAERQAALDSVKEIASALAELEEA